MNGALRKSISRAWGAAADGVRRFRSAAAGGNEPLWKVWWLGGIPVGWTTSALVIAAEELRLAGLHGWGEILDVVRLLIYFIWFRFAWRCADNVRFRPWTPLARTALLGGLVLMAVY